MHGSDEEPQQVQHEARVNQRRHEPVPASHQADGDEPAPTRGEPRAAHDERPAARSDEPPQRDKAIRDMMGGPAPQVMCGHPGDAKSRQRTMRRVRALG